MTDEPNDDIATKANELIASADRTQASDNSVLDTGMTVKQAVDMAMIWWETKGRKMIRANHTGRRWGRRTKVKTAFFTADPKDETEAMNSLPSGILKGLQWINLTREERLDIVKHWHHQFVRLPMGQSTEAIKRLTAVPGKCFYCTRNGEVFEDLPTGESREMCIVHWRDRYPEQFKGAMN